MKKFALLVIAGILTAALFSTDLCGATNPSQNRISGTVQFYGCNPVGENPFWLHAITVVPSQVKPAGKPQTNNKETLVARINKIRDGLYNFTFDQAEPGKFYSLKAKLLWEAQDKIVWRAELNGQKNNGQVVAGTSDFKIKAYAIRTKVEVLSEIPASAKSSASGKQTSQVPAWVGAAHMDFFDEASATRHLRVYSDLPNITSVVLQISNRVFPREERAIVESLQETTRFKGIIASISRPVDKQGWTDLGPINFKQLMTICDPRSDNTICTPGDEHQGERLSLADVQAIKFGAPVYVRAIPVIQDDNGVPVRLTDPTVIGFPGWVILSNFGASPITGSYPDPGSLQKNDHIYTANYTEPHFDWLGHPKIGEEACYVTVKEHQIDPNLIFGLCFSDQNTCSWDIKLVNFGAGYSLMDKVNPWNYMTSTPGLTIPAGYYFCESLDTDSWLDDFLDFVTGLIDGFGWLVTQFAELYERIKSSVESVIVEVVNIAGEPFGIQCGEGCQKWVEAGMDSALAAMGLPPSLPNWDELKDKGLDYLTRQIAEQSGIGSLADTLLDDVAKEALKGVANHAGDYANALINQLGAKNRGGYGVQPPVDWLTAYSGFEPAVMTFTFTQTGSLDLLDPVDWHFYIGQGNVFAATPRVPLPKDFPWISNTERKLSVPIVLRPNMAGYTPCPAWRQHLSPYDQCSDIEQAFWIRSLWVQDMVTRKPCADLPTGLYTRPQGWNIDPDKGIVIEWLMEQQGLSNPVLYQGVVYYPEPLVTNINDMCWILGHQH